MEADSVRRGTVLLVVAAATVLLAGCGANGIGGGRENGEPTSTPTLTPVAVPAETGPAGGRLLAPGLSTNGVVDAGALVGVWYSEPVVRNRFVNEGRVERYWGQDCAASGGPVRDTTRSGRVRSDLAAVDLRVVGNTTVDGTAVYRLRGSRIADPEALAVPPLLSDPRNASMVARVDERGVVRAYTLTFDVTFGEDRVRVRRTHRVGSIGNVAVERPGWLSEANASVGGGG